jgi:UDP-2,4-diacetamido-2,4,6-trideoxy-beta-L-altropyranose hydrolase
MYKISILCKAGFLTGMGHVVRQIHLARVLRNRGMDIKVFVTDHPPSIELLRRENFSAKVIAKKEDLPGELDATCDLVLLDVQDTNKDFIGALRERSRKIMSFEDLGGGRNHVDLLVDCNLEPEQAQYLKPPVKALFGLSYSVLAEEFGQYHQRKKIFSESLETLLVTMGGTDPNNLTMQLAQCFLQSRRKTSITFVAGPGFRETPALIQLASSVDSFQVLQQPGNMAELLFHHQAVCCSGGVTLHEALAVGTPAFVISQVMAQQEKTRPLEKRGTAIDLGLAKDFDAKKISRIWELTKTQLENMSARAKELVDGQGIVRVADEVIALLSN